MSFVQCVSNVCFPYSAAPTALGMRAVDEVSISKSSWRVSLRLVIKGTLKSDSRSV